MTILNSITDRPQQRSRSGSLLVKSHSPENSIASLSELVSKSSSSSSNSLDSECHPFDLHENHVRSKRSRVFSLVSKLNTKFLYRICCLAIPLFLLSVYILIQNDGLRVLWPKESFDYHLRRGGSLCSNPKWTYPNCRRYLKKFGDDSPLAPEEWYHLREIYEQVVGLNASTLDPYWRDDDDRHHLPKQQQVVGQGLDGFRVPVEIRTSPGKGRGVFLTEPVSKDQIIWDNRYTARFPDECSTRDFMNVLDEESACNIIMWGYVNDFFGQGLQFQVDLDRAVYLNEPSTKAQANVVMRFPKELLPSPSDPTMLHHPDSDLVPTSVLERRRKPGSFPIYAKEDLPEGTELLLQYDDAHIRGLYWYDKMCFMSRGLWQWWIQI